MNIYEHQSTFLRLLSMILILSPISYSLCLTSVYSYFRSLLSFSMASLSALMAPYKLLFSFSRTSISSFSTKGPYFLYISKFRFLHANKST